MNKSIHVSISRVLLALSFALAAHTSIQADVPGEINFQGLLKDGSGNPVADGSYSVDFTIYDAPTGGAALWTQTYSVTTSGGLFTVLLGSGPTPIPSSVFDYVPRYLGIKVGADPEMTPRQPLTSVGYSFSSSQWTSADPNLYRLSGNVGIGTFPGSARLDVQSFFGTALNLQGGTDGLTVLGGATGIVSNGGTTGIVVSGGNVGIDAFGNTRGINVNGGSYGVYSTTLGSGDGVYASSGSGNGVNAYGGTRGLYASGGSYGVVAGSTSGTGVWAGSTSGYGVYASGGPNGVVASASSGAGVYATSGSGDGVYGAGAANGFVGSGGVRGMYVTGGSYGVVAAPTADFGTGVYGSDGGTFSYAAQFLGLVDVFGDFNCYGSKSAVVPMDNGEFHAVYAVESPESWFEDFGTAQMVKGRAVVTIEPGFAQTVNTTVAYHVFLTPKGDCNGLYVTNEGPNSFEIRELQKGRSDLQVTYRIVAKRKGHEHLRLAMVDGPTPQEMRAKDATMRSEMVANAADQAQLHARMEAEHARQEAERVAIEKQKAASMPAAPDSDVRR